MSDSPGDAPAPPVQTYPIPRRQAGKVSRVALSLSAICCVLLLALLAFLTLVVPRFERFFADFGAVGPAPTITVLRLSQLVRSWAIFVVPPVLVAMAGLIYLPIRVRRRLVTLAVAVFLVLLVVAGGFAALVLWIPYRSLAHTMR